MSALLASYFLFYLPHFHRFASAPTTFLIADYNGTCEPTAFAFQKVPLESTGLVQLPAARGRPCPPGRPSPPRAPTPGTTTRRGSRPRG